MENSTQADSSSMDNFKGRKKRTQETLTKWSLLRQLALGQISCKATDNTAWSLSVVSTQGDTSTQGRRGLLQMVCEVDGSLQEVMNEWLKVKAKQWGYGMLPEWLPEGASYFCDIWATIQYLLTKTFPWLYAFILQMR